MGPVRRPWKRASRPARRWWAPGGLYRLPGLREGLACRNHRCSADPPAGLAGDCLDESDCGPDLYCRALSPLSSEGKGVFDAKRPEGAACSSTLQCRGICVAGKCASFCGAG